MKSTDADLAFWGELAKHQSYLVHVARKMFRVTADEAHDLAQETVLKAFENRDKFVPGSNLKGWLTVILRNYKLSQVRRGWRLVFTDTPEERPAADDAFQSILLQQVITQFATLPRDQIDAMVLSIRGFSIEAMAVELGIPDGTVKSRIARGRRALQNLVEGGP